MDALLFAYGKNRFSHDMAQMKRQTLTIRINHKQKHRIGTVSNKLLGVGEGAGSAGLNRLYVEKSLALGFAVVKKRTSYSARVKDFIYT